MRDLIPTSAADILRISPERAMNIAIANVRNPDTVSSLIASSVRKMETIRTEIEMLEATLAVYDLTPKKVKVSKRTARVPKYARSVTKGRAMSTVGDSYMKGGVKSRGRDFADKAAV